jgi:hypothetical protein
MRLNVLLQILWALECLATELAFVRLQGNMDSNMGGNVITFNCGGAALTPCAGEVEVVGRLATNMAFTNMFLMMVRYDAMGLDREGSTYIEGFW